MKTKTKSKSSTKCAKKGVSAKRTPKKSVSKFGKENFSSNKKLNSVLNSIKKQLLDISDTKKESVEQVIYCKKHYSKEPDFNIAQSGFLMCDNNAVRAFYKKKGYAVANVSDEKLWSMYLAHIGYVAKKSVAFK